MPVPFADAAIDAAAVYRITRLIQEDSIPPLPALREAVLDRWGHKPASDLLTCPWCLGMWVAALVALARWRFPRAWPTIARVLAGSAVAGVIAERMQ